MLSVGAVAVKMAETASSLNLLPLERGNPMLMGESGGDLGGGVGGRSVSLDLEKTRPSDNFRTMRSYANKVESRRSVGVEEGY
jgi:hypothetical protein